MKASVDYGNHIVINGCLNELVQPGRDVLIYWHTNLTFQSILSEKMSYIIV